MKKTLVVLLATGLLLAASPAKDTKVTFDVKGWTCGACVDKTKTALTQLDGVQAVEADLEKATTVVTYDESKVSPQQMTEAVKKAGFTAAVKADKGGSKKLEPEKPGAR